MNQSPVLSSLVLAGLIPHQKQTRYYTCIHRMIGSIGVNVKPIFHDYEPMVSGMMESYQESKGAERLRSVVTHVDGLKGIKE